MSYLCSKIVCRMKKIIFTLLAIVMLCTTAHAGSPVNFGITAGMNIAKGEVSNDKANWKGWSPDSENGWFAGIQLKFTLPIIGLGIDGSLIYSRENVSIPVECSTVSCSPSTEMSEVSGLKNENEHLDYLAVPLHLRYDLQLPAVSYAFVPYIFAGPQAGLTLSKIDKSYQDKIETEDLVWRFDLGAGVILLKHLQASYSYSFPLSKTYEGKFKDQTSQFESDYKQGVHRISLTYFF